MKFHYTILPGGYRVDEDISIHTGFVTGSQYPQPARAANGLVALDSYGWLTISAGYFWDGASGPAIDTADFMRASCAHDALYLLIREGRIDHRHRKAADQLMRRLAREDGMGAFRAWYAYRAVRWAGGNYVN